MPSNVFIYQLPIKPAPISDTDLFIIEDMGTKQVPASALRNYFFDYLGEAIVPKLSTTEFFASSARFSVVDITSYELSGFKSTGDLTVEGNLNATKVIYTSNYGNSIEWDSVHSLVNTTSGNWQSSYTTVQTNSASWAIDSTTDTDLKALSSNWQSTYTTVSANSGNWNSVYTSVNNTSGSWDTTYTSVKDTSGSWNSVYTTVNSSSADNTLTTTLCAISGNGAPFIMSFTRGLLTGVTWN